MCIVSDGIQTAWLSCAEVPVADPEAEEEEDEAALEDPETEEEDGAALDLETEEEDGASITLLVLC